MVAEVTARSARWPLAFAFQFTAAGHLAADVRTAAGQPQPHLVCGVCGQSVLCLATDLGRPDAGYQVTPRDIAASTGAHIRQCHDQE